MPDHFWELYIKELRIRFHQCLLWKENLNVNLLELQKACEIKEFWPHSLQLAEKYYILLVLLWWMENSYSHPLYIFTIFKSPSTHYIKVGYNTHVIKQSWFTNFSPKMSGYSQDRGFYRCLTEISGTFIKVSMITKQR